jgi:ribA/ribD-fused uncharacterized protein|tara:strand:+ start:2226 stop:3164 length:939 start_codon:yes stop_codon:yes gene_type:complete
MERSSYFIKDRAMFGSFPTQEAVEELEKNGVRNFVNLTRSHERKITPYKTQYHYISFPITDHQVPDDRGKFASFIVKIADIIYNLKKGELVYIHCKGGHGRSGIVVAALLCHIFGMSPREALEHTTMYHSNRKTMREKWRQIGSPQTYQQKGFVHQLCKFISFYRAYKVGRTAGFSNFAAFPVKIKNFGEFPTSEAALQAYKDPENKEYVKKQIAARTPLISKNMGARANLRDDWEKVREGIMYKILKFKFSQHPYLRKVLLATGLSPIIHRTREDLVWGDAGGKGLNLLGKLLVRLRTQYQRELFLTKNKG